MGNLSIAYVALAFALAVGGGALGATLGTSHERLCALISLGGLYDGEPTLALWRLGREISFNIAIVYAMRVGAVFMGGSPAPVQVVELG